MFKKLFSKENQTTSPKSTQTNNSQNNQVNNQYEYEKTLDNLNKTISKIEASSEKIEDKLDSLDEKIKELVQAKQSKNARNKIKEAQGYKNQLERFDKQKNALFGMKIRLEAGQINKQSFKCFDEANQLLKESNNMNEELEKEISKYQDFLVAEKEQDQMWQELENCETKDMDLDSELERIEAEMNMQNSLKQKSEAQKISSISTKSSSSQYQQYQNNQMIKSMEKLLI